MRGPRDLRLRLKLVAHNAVDRRITKLQVLLLSEPPLNFLVATEALRFGEALFKPLHDVGGNRLLAGLRPRILNLLDLLDSALLVKIDPVSDRVAMDAQLASGRASTFGLPSFHPEKHLEAALNLSVFLLSNQVLEPLGRFGDLGEIVHGRREQ